MKIIIPIVDCFDKAIAGSRIELSKRNVSLTCFKLINSSGEEVDGYLRTKDLKIVVDAF